MPKLRKAIRKVLPFLIITAVITLLIFIGTIELQVTNGGEPTLDQMLQDALDAMIDPLFEAQTDEAKVVELMEKLHSETLFRLEARLGGEQQKRYTSSLIMAFAVINTLGDSRIDNSKTVFHLLYAVICGVIYMLAVGLLTVGFTRFFNRLFGFGEMEQNDEDDRDNGKQEFSLEYFYVHLQKQRMKKSSADLKMAFGGNKKELFVSQFHTMDNDIQPACAMVLIALSMLFIFGLLWIIVMPINVTLIESILTQYTLCFSITLPKFLYLHNPHCLRLIYLLLNMYIGNIVMTAMMARIGGAFFEYLDAITKSTPRRNYQDEFNLSPLWKDYTSYEARMERIYPLVDRNRNEKPKQKSGNSEFTNMADNNQNVKPKAA